MWATSIGSTFSHSPVPGRAEVRDPRRHGDPGARQRHHRAGRADQLGQRGGGTNAHFPLNSGVRLPRNAPMPSRASSDTNAFVNASFSAAMPSSRSPLWEACLISSSASGAWLGELARPLDRGVEQLVVLHDAVDQAVLVGVLGRDRLARGVHLERLGRPDEPRQPLRAAEAGDDPEVDLGLAERGREARDAHVARHRQLAAAAEREPVDGRDRHRPRLLPGAQQACAPSSSSRPDASSIFVNALMSAPAQNSAGFGEARISACTDGSPSAASHALPQPLDHVGRDRVGRRVVEPRDRVARRGCRA